MYDEQDIKPSRSFDDIDREIRGQQSPSALKPPKPAKSFDDIDREVRGQDYPPVLKPLSPKKEALRRSVIDLQRDITKPQNQVTPNQTLNLVTGEKPTTGSQFTPPVSLDFRGPTEGEKMANRALGAPPAPSLKPKPMRTAMPLAPRPSTLERIQNQQAIERRQPETVETDPAKLEAIRQNTAESLAYRQQRQAGETASRNRTLRQIGGALNPAVGLGNTLNNAGVPDVNRVLQSSGKGVGSMLRGAAEASTMYPGAEGMYKFVTGNSLRDTANRYGQQAERLTNQASEALLPEQAQDQSFRAKLERGAGSILLPVGAALATGGGSAVSAGIGALTNLGQVASERDASGVPVSDTRRALSNTLAVATGMTEALGIGRMLDRVGLKTPLVHRVAQMVEEGGQEYAQDYLNDINAKLVAAYDPQRQINDPLAAKRLESAAIGAILGGAGEVADVGAQRIQQQVQDRAAVRNVANERPPVPTDIRPTMTGPTRITPIVAPEAKPVTPQENAQITPTPEVAPAALPVPSDAAPAFPRLPEPEGFNARRAKLLGMDVPAEVGINERVQAANQLLASTNAGDQRQGQKMLRQALSDLRKSEGYLAEATAPEDAPKPFTAVRDAIESTLAERSPGKTANTREIKPQEMISRATSPSQSTNSVTGALRAEADAAKIKAAEFEQSGDFANAAQTYDTTHKNLKLLRRKLGVPKTAEDVARINQIDREISAAASNRQRATAQARQMTRQANAPTAGLAKPATFSPSKSAQVQSAQPDARNISGDISAPLLRPEAVQNPEGGIPSVEKSAKGLRRNYRAGMNNGQIEFASDVHRDLYDLAAKQKYQMRGGQNKTNNRAVGDISGLMDSLRVRTGLTDAEIGNRASEVYKNVAEQMKGMKDGELRKVVDATDKTPTQQLQQKINDQEAAQQSIKGSTEDLTIGGMLKRRFPEGIRLADKGEARNLGGREGNALVGLVNKNSRVGVDDVAYALHEEGLRLPDGRPFVEDGRVTATEADVLDFLKSNGKQKVGGTKSLERKLAAEEADYNERQQPSKSFDEIAADVDSETGALQRAIDRSNERGHVMQEPGVGLVSMSPYADMVARNQDAVDRLYQSGLASPEGKEIFRNLREFAAKNGIEARHLHALADDVRNHELEKARWADKGIDFSTVQSLDEGTARLGNSILEEGRSLPDVERTALEREVAALDALFEDTDATNLLARAAEGDNNAANEFKKRADEYGIGADTIGDLIQARTSDRSANRAPRQAEARAPQGAGRDTRTAPEREARSATPEEFDLLNRNPATIPNDEMDAHLRALEKLRNDNIRGIVKLAKDDLRELRRALKNTNDERQFRVKQKQLGPKNEPRYVPTMEERRAKWAEEEKSAEVGVKVGDYYTFTEPTIAYKNGEPITIQTKRRAKAIEILPDGSVKLKRQEGGYATKQPSELMDASGKKLSGDIASPVPDSTITGKELKPKEKPQFQNSGGRLTTEEGRQKVEAARQAMEDAIRRNDYTKPGERADAIAAARERVQEAQAEAHLEAARIRRLQKQEQEAQPKARVAEQRSGEIPPMPERYTGRELAANAQVEYKQLGRRPKQLFFNDWGGELMRRSFSDVFDHYTEGNLVAGVEEARLIEEHIREASKADIYAADQQASLRQIADTIAEAIQDASSKGMDVAFISERPNQTREQARSQVDVSSLHEAFHLYQNQAVYDAVDLTDEAWLDRQPFGSDIHFALSTVGYPRDIHAFEAAAFVASGDYPKFGMSLNDAKQFLNGYFKAIVRKHGRAALDKFAEIDAQLQDTLEEVKNENGQSTQAETDASSERATSNTRRGDSARDDTTKRRGPTFAESRSGSESVSGRGRAGIKQVPGKRFSFGSLPSEPQGQLAASGLGGLQDLFSRKPKPKAAQPVPVPKDFQIESWARNTLSGALANALPKAEKAKYDAAQTPKEKNAILMSAPLNQSVEAEVYKIIDRAIEASDKNDGRALMEAVRDAKEYSQAPPTNWEKASAMRKAFMLSRPVTHARNIIGNTLFQPLEEAARIPGSIADSAIGLMTGQRTLKGANPIDMANATYKAATDGMRRAKDVMRGLDVDSLEDATQTKEIKFKTKIVDSAVKYIFRSLNAEDQVFFTYAYDRALREQAKLTSLNERKAGVIGRTDAKARAEWLYDHPTEQMDTDAMTAAEVAVFRNKNKLSSAIQSARTSLGDKGSFAVDLFLPFDKTPTNIIARTLEYTPLGGALAAGKAASAAGRTVKNFRANRGEGMPSKQAITEAINKAMTPAQQRRFSELVGRSTVGTAAPILLGYTLAAAGAMTGFYDEEDRKGNKIQKETGARPASIKIGGRWYQVGGIPPLGSLLALGATLHKETSGSDDTEDEALGMAKGIGKVIADVPLLKSTNDLLDAMQKKGSAGQKVGRIASSFVPGALSDVGQVIPGVRDPVERNTFPDKKQKGLAGFSAAVKNEVQAKIPVWRKSLPEKKTPSGRPIETEYTDVIDPFNSRPATGPEEVGGVTGERMRQGVFPSEVKPKKGEPEAVFNQRKARVEGWMDEYGQKLLDSPRYKAMTADEQKAAMQLLRARIGRQQNLKQPKPNSFEPNAVLLGVKKSAATKARRQSKYLYQP